MSGPSLRRARTVILDDPTCTLTRGMQAALLDLAIAAKEWEVAEGANHAADFTSREHETYIARELAVANLRKHLEGFQP